MKRTALAIAMLAATGCHSYLVPFDERLLAAEYPAETRGGSRLDLDHQGELIQRPGAGDVSAVLGVGLHETDQGLVVTHRLRAETLLEPRDRIVFAAAVLSASDGQDVKAIHERALHYELGLIDEVDKTVGPLTPVVEHILEDASLRTGVVFDRYDPGVLDPDLKMLRPYKPPLPEGVAPIETATVPMVRAMLSGHAVRRLEDLSGYLAGAGWLELDLIVVRHGTEIVVRQPLREATEWLPVRQWRPQSTQWHGFDLVRVTDLRAELRPVHAQDGDLLVTRVARGSPAGRAGLRPLDVIPAASLRSLLGDVLGIGTTVDAYLDTKDAQLKEVEQALYKAHERYRDDESKQVQWTTDSAGVVVVGVMGMDESFDVLQRFPAIVPTVFPSSDSDGPVVVRAPDGSEKQLEFAQRQSPTSLWFPFLFSYHNDGVRTHVGFGPLDLLFHYSSRTDYVPTTDSYEQTWRWSWGTLLQGHGVERESGESSSEGIHLLLDGARIQYFGEWMDSYGEAKERRGWSGY